MFTIARQRRLRWLGHVRRTKDGWILTDILYRKFINGKLQSWSTRTGGFFFQRFGPDRILSCKTDPDPAGSGSNSLEILYFPLSVPLVLYLDYCFSSWKILQYIKLLMVFCAFLVNNKTFKFFIRPVILIDL